MCDGGDINQMKYKREKKKNKMVHVCKPVTNQEAMDGSKNKNVYYYCYVHNCTGCFNATCTIAPVHTLTKSK